MSATAQPRPDVVVLSALDQRLLAAAKELLPAGSLPEPSETTHAGQAAAMLLLRLLGVLEEPAGPSHWLVLTAIAGRFPLATDVQDLARRLVLDDLATVAEHLLSRVIAEPERGRVDLEMDIVADQVVVDTDYCARHDYNAGVQRVVRRVMPLWAGDHDLVAVAHIDQRTAYRRLAPREIARVLAFGDSVEIDPDVEAAYKHRLVVPWNTTVLWPEVLDHDTCRSLAGLAQYSGNVVGLIGYDMIPINSAHLRRKFGEAGEFGQYLDAVKHSHRVAAISSSAAAEFSGFADMLAAQGLAGPTVLEVELAEEVGHLARVWSEPAESRRPLALITCRRDPHKNVRAALHAAERLWAVEGLDFDLVVIGGEGLADEEIASTVKRLRKRGFPVTMPGWVPDDEMLSWIQRATFVVFTSLHEGFGLPVAEALACGTPVITANYGSQAEIGARGGCMLVDPRSDTEIAGAMRIMIQDPTTVARLRAEITRRPRRLWEDYARDAWAFLVHGTDVKHDPTG